MNATLGSFCSFCFKSIKLLIYCGNTSYNLHERLNLVDEVHNRISQTAFYVVKKRYEHGVCHDCIGSAFNVKGSMQCPNCRKIEKGQWLYDNGSRPMPEFSMDEWAHDEDLYDLSYSEMVCCKLLHFWKLFMGLLVQELPPVFITFVAWSISEVIIYSHYALNSIGSPPSWITWIRYNAFIVLYPIGVFPGENSN